MFCLGRIALLARSLRLDGRECRMTLPQLFFTVLMILKGAQLIDESQQALPAQAQMFFCTI